ncbi:DUF1636 family protein [Desertibaculum subflavum]|uniref:DUF1636 family protein n=1 Tax=Desertibaculum subflavum TaxID=2268458 RepID=UPI000E65F640
MAGSQPQILVCTTCRHPAVEAREGTPPPGQLLCDRIGELAEAGGARPAPVTCFGNCERGCTVVVAAPGKWAYMLGHLTPDHAADLVAYAAAYAQSETGFVGRGTRPASLRTAIVVRFPLHLINLERSAP